MCDICEGEFPKQEAKKEMYKAPEPPEETNLQEIMERAKKEFCDCYVCLGMGVDRCIKLGEKEGV